MEAIEHLLPPPPSPPIKKLDIPFEDVYLQQFGFTKTQLSIIGCVLLLLIYFGFRFWRQYYIAKREESIQRDITRRLKGRRAL